MDEATTLDLVVALSEPHARAAAVVRLARRLEVEVVVLLVRDPAVGALIPVPGMAATLRGGPSWRAFLAACSDPGVHRAEVELPAGEFHPAVAILRDGLAVVLVGGNPSAAQAAVLESLLPLLSATIRAESAAHFARAEVLDAREAASRAHALAVALEAARAETAMLNIELRAEQRLKDDFLAMLAHELRNPLTPLVTAIELLRRQRDDPAASTRYLDIMSRQLRQLSRLVEDLLDVSRVSRGRIDLRRHRVELGDVLSEALESARPVLDARGHTVTCVLPPEPLPLEADSVRLTQVFSNLLHNAAKYTDPSGRIEIVAHRDGDEVVARVKDNGIGITREMLPRVFDLFAQAPVSLARAQGGLGIGLTLVNALVQLHGGTVSAQSEGIGRGSTFTVRLPLLVRPVQAELPAPAPDDAHDSERVLRVLIVDDNKDAADSMADIWRIMGHHAEAVYSGIKALQIATDLEPDLVLLDIGLPDLDGYEVARRMRRMVNRAVRLIAVTGYGTDEDKRRSREAGFDEHMVKPVDPAALAGITQRTGAVLAVASRA